MDKSKWVQPSSEWTEEERINVAEGLREVLKQKAGQGSTISAVDAWECLEVQRMLYKDSSEMLEACRERILFLARFTHAPSR